MNIKKLHTKSGVHYSPLMLFRKPEFFHRFSAQHKNYTHNGDNGLLCSPHLVHKSLQRESDEYIQLGRISKLDFRRLPGPLVIEHKELVDFDFPVILSRLPIMPLEP